RALAGRPAPEGMSYLTVELRARSKVTMDADATAFDPKAKRGSRIDVGTVADWRDWRQYTQVVLDGEFAYGPLETGGLPDVPRFLPDVMTGGTVTFLVPDEAQSVELRCGMPNASLPGSGKVIRPKALTFTLQGKRAALPERRALVSIDDEVFGVQVTGQQVASGFAGEEAGPDTRFLVLDVTVANTGRKIEGFQTEQQLAYASEDGSRLGWDEVSFRGRRPPMRVLWIPQGERRSFQVVFRVPAGDTKPRLAYQGLSLARVEPLPELAPGKPSRKPEEVVRKREEVGGEPDRTTGKPAQPTEPPERPEPPARKPEEVVEKPERPAKPPAAPKPPAEPRATPARRPEGLAELVGKPLPGFEPLGAAGGGVEWSVLDARLAGECLGKKANEGETFLLVQLRWRRLEGVKRWSSGRLDLTLFLRRAGLFVEPVWHDCWRKEGFVPYHFALEKETAAATYTAVFPVPEGSLQGSELVFVPQDAPALTLPIAPPSGEAARLPVLASDQNEVVELTVHDLVEPGKEVREQLASHL
ncbi:MAG: hypothetical protein ACE5JG_13215, partial [Planctomycetota bacterium]